jgi:hypothetical protein
VNVEELKNDEIYRCAENLKCFLKNARSKLENSDQIAKPLETILELMNVPKDVDLNKTKVPPGVVNKIMDAVKQIQNATKREV